MAIQRIAESIDQSWFAVHKEGLAQVIARRGSGFGVLELVQNGLDQRVTRVDVQLTPDADAPGLLSNLVVADDDPDGFADLTHAYTLFAPSAKKSDAEMRGRFNLGEKLVLAICDTASIRTTKGTVQFLADGTRRITPDGATKGGSIFTASIRMDGADRAEAERLVRCVIAPAGITVTLNGEALPDRAPLHTFQAVLSTELADKNDGRLRPTSRKTTIRVFEPRPGEVPTIYELGIPVVELDGDVWHIDVGQKIPLNMDRDNVRPAYLRSLRALVANVMYADMDSDAWRGALGTDALADEHISPDATRAAVTAMFGEKAVRYDPSDPEANKKAVSEGYTVVSGGSLTKDQWGNVNRYDLLEPAGRVTPSDARNNIDRSTVIKPDRWTEGQRQVAAYAVEAARILLGVQIKTTIYAELGDAAYARYGGRELLLNVAHLGKAWFDVGITDAVDKLLIHEFGHEFCGDHLSEKYHDALCEIGMRAIRRGTELRKAAGDAVATRDFDLQVRRRYNRLWAQAKAKGPDALAEFRRAWDAGELARSDDEAAAQQPASRRVAKVVVRKAARS